MVCSTAVTFRTVLTDQHLRPSADKWTLMLKKFSKFCDIPFRKSRKTDVVSYRYKRRAIKTTQPNVCLSIRVKGRGGKAFAARYVLPYSRRRKKSRERPRDATTTPSGLSAVTARGRLLTKIKSTSLRTDGRADRRGQR